MLPLCKKNGVEKNPGQCFRRIFRTESLAVRNMFSKNQSFQFTAHLLGHFLSVFSEDTRDIGKRT